MDTASQGPHSWVTGCIVGVVALGLIVGIVVASLTFKPFLALLPFPLAFAYIAFEMITGRKRISAFLFGQRDNP